MLKIGLTGGIGSGKSTVASQFAGLGAVVIDADAVAREVIEPGTAGFRRVVDRFGPGILRPDGAVDRPKLARQVFADHGALADLNAIVHPLVAGRSAELMAAAADREVVVYDVPLLVENQLQDEYDAVVVVEAPLELRLRRLVDRGLSVDEARARIARQASDADRRTVATIVLRNGGSVDELTAQVTAAWHRLVGDADSADC